MKNIFFMEYNAIIIIINMEHKKIANYLYKKTTYFLIIIILTLKNLSNILYQFIYIINKISLITKL